MTYYNNVNLLPGMGGWETFKTYLLPSHFGLEPKVAPYFLFTYLLNLCLDRVGLHSVFGYKNSFHVEELRAARENLFFFVSWGSPPNPHILNILLSRPGQLENKIFKTFKMGGWRCVGIQPVLPPPPAHLEYLEYLEYLVFMRAGP